MSWFSKLLTVTKPITEPVVDTVIGNEIESEALDRKVLHILQAQLRHINDLQIWLSHDYNLDNWNPILVEEQAKVDKIRAWAQTLPDRAVRHSYLQWIDYYFQIGLNDARKELQTQKIRKDHQVYDAKMKSIHLLSLEKQVPEPPR